MALTKGDRQKVTTVSSIQSRMGVVGTYDGDPIATAADSIGKNLDIYAQRMITIEEEQYKADLQINAIKTISDLSKKHNLDPEGFTNSSNAYIEAIVSKAPQRFKNWSKQFISLKAAQEGDQIFNKYYNNKQIDAIKTLETKNQILIDSELAMIMKKNPAEFDEHWQTSVLPILSEMQISYENLYNSLDPQYRSGMALPEEKLRQYKVAFEGARLNSKINDLLQVALSQDQKDWAGQKIPFGTGDTNVEEIAKQIKTQLLKDYTTNPTDEDSPFAVLTDTTLDERLDLVDKAESFIDSFIKTNEKIQKKIETQQEININENFNKAMGSIENFDLPPSLKDLNLIADQYGFSKEQKQELTEAYNISTAVEFYGSRESVNIEADISSLYRQLNDSYGYNISRDDLKEKILDYKIYSMINSDYVPEDGMPLAKDIASIDFSYDISNDVPSNDLYKITAFAAENGYVHSSINEFISSAKNLNYKTEADRMQLAEIAYTVNYLTSRAGFAVEGLDSELIQPLIDLHKSIQKMPVTGDGAGGVTEESAYEYFFSKINKDASVRDDIDLKIDSVLESEDFDLDSIIVEAIAEEQKKHFGIQTKTPMGITTEGYLTEPLFDIPGLRWLKITSDDLVQKDIDLVKSEIVPLIKLYLNYSYVRPEEVNIHNVSKNIKNAIKLSFSTLGDKGYGVE